MDSELNQANNPNKKTRVVVAMSGGVDSSVAAALLVHQGYEVIGVMMRLWSAPGSGGPPVQNRCCTPDQIAVAKQVARKLGIRFYVIDVQDLFYESVVKYFIDGHLDGETPNPCVACNKHIRFDYLLDHALSLGADYLATGHYARIRLHNDGYRVLKAKDEKKDQSYVLYVLRQELLQHLMFPIGDFSKIEVREMAEKYDLGLSSKAESMDLCFLADGDYRGFLNKQLPKQTIGNIWDADGQLLGEHQGLQNYTIGQRKGLGISSRQPLYVLSKNIDSNELVVGPRKALEKYALVARETNWISGKFPEDLSNLSVKIRYKARSTKASIERTTKRTVLIRFDEPVFGVTAGQAVVIYREENCLGGGIITNEIRE